MADKKLKTIKFPGLNDTYTVPQSAEDLPYNGSQAHTAGSVAEEISELNEDIADLGFSVVNGQLNTTFNI